MPLNDELKSLHESVLDSLQPNIRKELIIENAKLFSRFLEKKVILEGSKAPNILFRDENLAPTNLYDLLGYGHIVLSFFRGTWCPYCNLELQALSEIKGEINNRGAELIAISPELHKFSHDSLKENNINFQTYVDLGNKAADELGLVFGLPQEYREIYRTLNVHLNKLNGSDNWTLPIPATFIISQEGIITATYINADYTKRMEPNDILKQLDMLSV